jgi:galactose mutarotase-like enzyme
MVAGLPAIALREDELEVVVVPSAGMRITNLRRPRGREWLWRSDQIPLAQPVAGRSYVETADSGGWDECFPTVAPSPIPGPPAGTPPLPDHGELWAATWRSSVYQHAGGTTIAASAAGQLLPYEFHRDLTVHPDQPVLRLAYRLRHLGDRPFPWIWSAHPLINVQPGSVLELPTLGQVRLDAVHGRSDLARNDIVSWPAGIGGEVGRFRFPEDGGWAVKCFGDVGASGRMSVTDPREGERLTLQVSPAAVPQVGLWINCRGWAPPGRTPYYNLGLEPCIGAPDSLADAAGAWGLAQTLAPGEERTWAMEVRLD